MGHWLYCLLSLYDEPISFGTEMYLRRAKTVKVCSLSYSWWEGPDIPDVIRPELPAGRSGPVRALTDVAGSGRTRPASGRSLVVMCGSVEYRQYIAMCTKHTIFTVQLPRQ